MKIVEIPVLLACVVVSTLVLAEQAPVEDRSTNSPVTGAGPAANQGAYSNDLRVPFGTPSQTTNAPALQTQSGRIDSTQNAQNNNSQTEPQTGYGRIVTERSVQYDGSFDNEPAAGRSAGSGNAQLFYKVQILEQEVRELRGLFEEQTYLIKRLQRDQKDQYLDLDRRLSQQVVSPGQNSLADPVDPSVLNTPASSEDPETQAYNLAFASTREKNYQEAIDGFNTLITNFPNGNFTGNAFYWLGELYLALEVPELEKSRQSFVQIVNLYPDHNKIPDSLYKLGVVYHRLGDLIRARQYLNQVTSQYPGSASARLANSYLADLP